MTANFAGITIRVPHPVRFSLHKLLISARRATAEKKANDRRQGEYVLKHLIEKGERERIRSTLGNMPRTWQQQIKTALDQTPDGESLIQLLFHGPE